MVDETTTLPKWKSFDYEWYSRRYQAFSLLIQDIYQGDVYAYYKQNGCKVGHSPNPYFDEKWYLNKYPEVIELIRQGLYQSGFDHYCQVGFETNSPHWLFSESYYKERYPQITQQIGKDKPFINGYDHYLQLGDKACLTGSFFFNPQLYLAQKENIVPILDQGPFQYLLTKSIKDFDVLRLSWFFDPKWYLEKYVEGTDLNKHNNFLNSLHHYLTNNTPTVFSPLIGFSEEFYYNFYQDLQRSISIDGQGLFRNGYEHFIVCGCDEYRKPTVDFDYDQFSKKEIELVQTHKNYHNIFEYWVAKQHNDLLQKINIIEKQLSIETSQKITQEKANIDSVDKEVIDLFQTQNKDVNLAENQDKGVAEDSYDQEITVKDGVDTLSDFSVERIEDVIEEYERDTKPPYWKIFDEEWYIRKYINVTSKMKALELDSIEEYYLTFGQYEGHSPNPYFDEQWYLHQYQHVKLMVDQREFSSGFDHYCKEGFRTYSPHWLFSESYYKRVNSYLTDDNLERHGFINGYDHFLKAGESEGISGSLFFDNKFFLEQYSQPIPQDLGPYRYYLKYFDQLDPTLRISWYFDPIWYASVYPEIEQEIEDGKYDNYLHHYLTNKRPFDFCPLAWFDENFYDLTYYEALTNQKLFEKYRNGYDHFVHEGIQHFWKPFPTIDLKSYILQEKVQKDLKAHLYPNVYVHWLAFHHGKKEMGEAEQNKETYDKQNQLKDLQQASWLQFDAVWYMLRYPDTQEKMDVCGIEDIEVYYQQIGSSLGHSPNPYFDEEWYLLTYPEIQINIDRGVYKSGFDHYCQQGYLKNDPHWLFSTHYYLKNNPDCIYEILNNSTFINAYDHYLKKGDDLLYRGSILFDPLVYQRECYQKGEVEKATKPYKNYLKYLPNYNQHSDVSLYFDTTWYLQTYPEVNDAITQGEYGCALHHYCLNKTPRQFNPSPWFSEEFYLETYLDLKEAICNVDHPLFRNGYEHFLLYGSLECRQPHPDVDLKTYFLSETVHADIEDGLFRDAFAHFVFERKLQAWLDKQPEDSTYRLSQNVQQSREYFRRKARIFIPLVTHQKLDFSYEDKPEISVIMLMHNHLPVTLMALASLRANFRGKIQLLIGDNHSTDDSRYLQSSIIGANIKRFPYNLGYGKACNILIKEVQAPIVVFLNNDLNLLPGAIDILCQRLLSSDTIGAVGGKIIHADGKLQEAGQIIWRDGTTTGYLRGDDPLLPEANFVRDVDYCSAAMLAVKTNILQELDGFSSLYYPAYFEDTDLCVRIIEAGYRIVYEPDAVVEHMEYASSDPLVSSGLIRRNHRQFVREHKDFLRYQSPRHSENILIARQRKSEKKRILFIEDRVPLKYLGSGYVRSNEVIQQMTDLGYDVTVYPINGFYPHLYQIYSDIPKTIEVLFNHTIDNISDFFKKRAGYYDVIWVGRTHNLHRILPMLGEANRYLPQDCIVLDTEVVATPRTRLRAQILGQDLKETFEEAIETELSCARHCQQIVAVNQIDAAYIEQAGFDNVNILGHSVLPRQTPKAWKERKDLLFVGALHDDLSPNYDSLHWFLEKVMPILLEKMEDDFTFSIVGYVSPSVDMAALANYPHVKLLGMVQDLTELYNNHRVYIAPTRFAGGIPYKLHEAASFGIPIVGSDLLVEQLGWKDDVDILAASVNNPDFFASQIIRLYHTEELWNKLRQNALQRIETECNQEQFKENLKTILSKVILHQ